MINESSVHWFIKSKMTRVQRRNNDFCFSIISISAALLHSTLRSLIVMFIIGSIAWGSGWLFFGFGFGCAWCSWGQFLFFGGAMVRTGRQILLGIFEAGSVPLAVSAQIVRLWVQGPVVVVVVVAPRWWSLVAWPLTGRGGGASARWGRWATAWAFLDQHLLGDWLDQLNGHWFDDDFTLQLVTDDRAVDAVATTVEDDRCRLDNHRGVVDANGGRWSLNDQSWLTVHNDFWASLDNGLFASARRTATGQVVDGRRSARATGQVMVWSGWRSLDNNGLAMVLVDLGQGRTTSAVSQMRQLQSVSALKVDKKWIHINKMFSIRDVESIVNCSKKMYVHLLGGQFRITELRWVSSWYVAGCSRNRYNSWTMSIGWAVTNIYMDSTFSRIRGVQTWLWFGQFWGVNTQCL